MLEGINILDLIIILGAIQGVIFSVYLWLRPLKSNKASRFLSLFILGFAASSIYYILEAIGLRRNLNIWSFSLFYSSLLILPSFYLFIKYLINPDRKFGLWDKLIFLPYALQFLLQLYGSFWVLKDHDYVIENQFSFYKAFDFIDLLALLLSVSLLILSVIDIRKYDKRLQNNYAEIEDYSLSWLNRLMIFILIVWILFAIPLVYELFTGYSPLSIYYPLWISSSILIYWIGYSTFFRQESGGAILYDQESPTEIGSLSTNTKAYHKQLITLMDEDKPYLDQDLNLKALADKLQLSSGYLSQIINKYEKMNFFEFVNGYRVEAVKEKIVDPEYSHLNLLGIGYESGFKSKSTFNLVFKKKTGMTPSAYKKSLR